MAWSPMGKSCSFGFQCVFCIMSRENIEGLFDKSRMKRPDICEAMKSMNFVLAPCTPGIRSA